MQAGKVIFCKSRQSPRSVDLRNSLADIAMFHSLSLNQRFLVCACAALAPLLLACAVAGGLTLVAATFASVVLLGVSLWVLRSSLRRDAIELSAFLHAIAAGDLRRGAVGSIGQIDDALRGAEAVAAKMSIVIAQVKSDSIVVSLEGAALLIRTRELSDRTDRQSSSMQETVAAVHELVASVTRSVESVHQVDRLSAEVQIAAHSGQAMMAGAAAGMTRIDGSASRVASVVAVIDRIAFQTNLLALNASVEAARAGDAGRGFAVVATEVRTLSQQCSQAAREVRQAIETSAADVRSGVIAMRDAEARLAEIAAHIGALARQSHAIATVTQQQSVGLEQILAAMVDMDASTQQNAHLAEVMSRAAQLLTSKAEKLADTVAFAKLRQGTADEAYALVLRAVARVEEVGHERAFADFHDRTAGFIDRDLYLIVADRGGGYLAFGARPDMVGRHMTDLPDFDAAGFLRDACEQVDQGGGWVEFQVVHPETRVLLDKVSYFTALGEDMLIGCGVFRQLGALSQ